VTSKNSPIEPSDTQALIDRAGQLIHDGKLFEAAEIYAYLSRRHPLSPDYIHLHGLALYEAGDLDAALEKITTAIHHNPDLSVYHRSHGDVLQAMGQFKPAIQAYQRALSLDAGDTDAMLNQGNALERLDHPDQARQCYQRVLQMDEGNIKALNNLGKIDYDMGFPEKAVQWYQKALAVSPDYAEARFNQALALLSMGDYENGWREYAWRFRRKTARQVYPHTLSSPRWYGEPYPDRRLLVHCEQGMGDVLQFIRFLPQVKQLGGTLIVEAHPPLLPVLNSMPCIDHLVGFNAERPADIAHDLHVPLLSLPHLFQTRLDTIPSKVPYIGVDKSRQEAWKSRLQKHLDGIRGIRAQGPRIGLIWSGSSLNPKRNLDVHQFKPLTDLSGIQFYSLQTGRQAEQLTIPPRLPVMPLGNELADFGDTAAIMAHMDLIISVDTAAAHLAGALGKPVWVLLPAGADWRWPLNHRDSPWYPNARIFRQTRPGHWDDVILSVSHHLGEFARSLTPEAPDTDQVKDLMANGYQLLYQGHSEQAAVRFRSITARQPDNAAAQYNLGLALQQQNDAQGAMAAYLRALSIHPKMERAWSNLGAIHLQQKNPSEARKCFQKAIELDPRPGTYYNLGNTYLSQRQPLAAIENYDKTLSLEPGHLKTLNNMARAWHMLGRYDISRRCLDKAIELKPDYAEARLNSAVHYLLLGDWDQGWQEYSWRFKCHDGPQPYAHHPNARPWRGQPLNGKRILVFSEQGLGDAIQFCRYIPLIHEKGGRVVFEVQASLHDVFKTLDGIDELCVVTPEKPYSGDYEWFVPLADLPRIFGSLPDSVPRNVPYLSADPSKAAVWKSRMDTDHMSVGLVWAGSDTYPERSCNLYMLSCLGEVYGIRWHGLQKGPAAFQANARKRLPGFSIVNWGDELNDFSDTAALIANLDLVITVDTSVAHLAGAMGKPTWVLLHAVPDWRWLLERTDSPWYPDMTLFRQSEWNRWNGAINAVKQRLHQFCMDQRPSNKDENGENLTIFQRDATNLFNSALKHKQAGRFNQAIAFFEKAAELDMRNPEIHYNLGNTYLVRGKLKSAIAAYHRVLERDPRHGAAMNNLGLAWKRTGDLSRAEAFLKKAVALEPGNATFHNNLGTILQARHKYTEAVEHFKLAIASHPEKAESHFNLGYSLQHSDALEAAAQSYRSALDIKPDFFDAHNNLGITLRLMGDFDQALKHHDQAVRLQPDNDDALWNRSLLHLLRGDWTRGWPGFEHRLTQSGWRSNYPYKHPTPRWNGTSLNGKRILVHDEQGLGDTLQFIRYLPLVKSRGGHVILETRQPLYSLLLGFNGIDELVVRSDGHRPDVPCDVHVPLLSLPMIFNTTPESIPGPASYLEADPQIAAPWKRRIPGQGLKVGFAWAGNPKHQNDAQRSCPLSCFQPLFQLEDDIHFFSLQKDADPLVKAEWFQRFSITDHGDRLRDFSDTAGLIHHLDLIISVDTAVVHLAGAMGKPAWVLLSFIPDWRWLMDRSDSPWYPGIRLFRQERRGDWPSVIKEVCKNLVNKFSMLY
jgi:tetratricopeptide (TPR) repeat protein/ADP-heptose:LPS heptosyltransferase